MELSARLFIFASTFLLGTFLASMYSSPPLFDRQLENLVPEVSTATLTDTSQRAEGLLVLYAGLGQEARAREPYLKFIVHNGLRETLSYVAQASAVPFPTLSSNGKDLPRPVYCGTGAREFYIPSGHSVEFHVTRYDFLGRAPKGEIRAGFYLRFGPSGKYHEVSSEPFTLRREFRDLLAPAGKSSAELIADE